MLFLVFALLICSVAAQSEPLKIVAATTDLAAVAREIGGSLVDVQTICPANQDPHTFEILPQHVISVRHADVYLKVGAGLDYWSDDLLRSSDNPRRIVADCSSGIELIRDTGEREHRGAHEHQLGNPHYWLAPSNTSLIAANIASALERADSSNAGDYANGLSAFNSRLDSERFAWRDAMRSCRGARMVTYHRAWDYLAREFGMQIIGTVEPQPGAEPSPTDLALLEKKIGDEHAALLILEPFESDRYAQLLEEDTGIGVVNVAPSVGATPETRTVFTWFDFLTREISAQCTLPSHPKL